MQITKYHGKLVSIFMALALVLIATPAAAGQRQEFEPDFYVSDMTGMEIAVSGPNFAISDAELQEYPTGEGEIVQISSETLAADLEVSFFDDADTPQESVDIYLQSVEGAADAMEVIDRGVFDGRQYALASIQYQGVDILFFVMVEEDIQGNVDMLQAILTTTLTIETDLAEAQAEVVIDGVSFMDSIVPADLANVAMESSTLGPADLTTPTSSAETFTFSGTDVTVGIGTDFAFLGESEQRTDVEAVRIQGVNTLSMIAVGETGSSPQVILDSFSSGIVSNYAEAEIVAEEVDSDSAWRLLLIPKSAGETTFMLIVVDSATVPGHEIMQAHELPSDSVAGSLVMIQEQITVNGTPVLSDFDPEEIADVARAELGNASPESSETAVATEVDTEAGERGRTGDPRSDARLPEIEDEPVETDPESGGNTSETGGNVDATAEPTEEPTAGHEDVPGELTDSSWEGEVHGHLIEWDADLWFVDTGEEGDLVSDVEYQEDTIVLQQQTPDGISLLWISVYGDTDLTPQDYLDHWLTEDYLTVFTDTGAEAEVLDYRTRSGNVAVLIQVTTADGDEYLIVRQAVILEDGSILVATLDTPAADMQDAYADAQDVTIDGQMVLTVFSPSHIQRVIGN